MSAVAAAFTAAMETFAPFENAPRLAVAVSGGADSLSLCFLARDWTAARGGRVTALTVDHRLRPESAEEARQVAACMARHGIEHTVFVLAGREAGDRASGGGACGPLSSTVSLVSRQRRSPPAAWSPRGRSSGNRSASPDPRQRHRWADRDVGDCRHAPRSGCCGRCWAVGRPTSVAFCGRTVKSGSMIRAIRMRDSQDAFARGTALSRDRRPRPAASPRRGGADGVCESRYASLGGGSAGAMLPRSSDGFRAPRSSGDGGGARRDRR